MSIVLPARTDYQAITIFENTFQRGKVQHEFPRGAREPGADEILFTAGGTTGDSTTWRTVCFVPWRPRGQGSFCVAAGRVFWGESLTEQRGQKMFKKPLDFGRWSCEIWRYTGKPFKTYPIQEGGIMKRVNCVNSGVYLSIFLTATALLILQLSGGGATYGERFR